MINILKKLTGGRPMTFIQLEFLDVVNGRYVNQYEDMYGRRWLSQSKWSRFRVRLEDK